MHRGPGAADDPDVVGPVPQTSVRSAEVVVGTVATVVPSKCSTVPAPPTAHMSVGDEPQTPVSVCRGPASVAVKPTAGFEVSVKIAPPSPTARSPNPRVPFARWSGGAVWGAWVQLVPSKCAR